MFPTDIATSLTSYLSIASRADPGRGSMQIMPGRNLTDRQYVTAETSIFTAAIVIRVRMGEALWIYHDGMKVRLARSCRSGFKQTHRGARASRDNGIGPIRASFPSVSRFGYFGHPPDYGNDESTAPCIA